jgi:glyoxylase-like metal-dependent hydrolase (beta-lactamase superfamily II)
MPVILCIVDELRPGLWTWTAPHPEWHEQPVVRSYAVERGGTLVLIDPLAPPRELIAGRELRVALTCPWHARSAPELGAPEAEVESRPGFYPDEQVLWLEELRALVFGDSYPGGPIPDDWLPTDRTREEYRTWFAALLQLPVTLLLPTHGDPDRREHLARARD